MDSYLHYLKENRKNSGAPGFVLAEDSKITFSEDFPIPCFYRKSRSDKIIREIAFDISGNESEERWQQI